MKNKRGHENSKQRSAAAPDARAESTDTSEATDSDDLATMLVRLADAERDRKAADERIASLEAALARARTEHQDALDLERVEHAGKLEALEKAHASKSKNLEEAKDTLALLATARSKVSRGLQLVGEMQHHEAAVSAFRSRNLEETRSTLATRAATPDTAQHDAAKIAKALHQVEEMQKHDAAVSAFRARTLEETRRALSEGAATPDTAQLEPATITIAKIPGKRAPRPPPLPSDPNFQVVSVDDKDVSIADP